MLEFRIYIGHQRCVKPKRSNYNNTKVNDGGCSYER